ncbi:hypothetical protein [Rhodococcus sp. NPDC059234]|uniref:hypothetical protein n=1 Tax=Rhodococcus sp. NPDC059234 TaxID=3346781 RepID=UPI00366C7D05
MTVDVSARSSSARFRWGGLVLAGVLVGVLVALIGLGLRAVAAAGSGSSELGGAEWVDDIGPDDLAG